MKFTITRVWGNSPRKYKLEEKGFDIEYLGDAEADYEDANIEIDSMEELQRLVDELQEPIIIDRKRIDSGDWELEIYDDYRE